MKGILKYIFYTFLIIHFFNSEISAQDYQIFFSNRMYIYEYQSADKGHFAVFKSDSLSMNGSDSIFSNYRSWDDDQLYTVPLNNGNWTASLNDSTWCGYKCIIKNSGENILLTHNSDSLIFYPNAAINDSWTFYKFRNGEKYIASVTAIANDTIFGLLDSIKSFILNKIDSSGALVQDTLNNFEFKLSKKYGLLNLVNVKHFPLQTNVYHLKGIDSIAGDQAISPTSMYDFNVGDVFHYYSWNHVSASVIQAIYEKRVILTKTVTTSVISYTIDDSVLTETADPLGLTSNLVHHIVTERHSTNLYTPDYLFQVLPHAKNNFIFNSFYIGYITTWHRWSPIRRGIYTTSCISNQDYGPSPFIYRSSAVCRQPYCNFPSGSNWFIEGLGLFSQFSSYDSASSSVYSCFKQMQYYKKGSEEYGTPLEFHLTTSIEESILFDSSIKIYPNPSNEYGIIENVEKISTIYIYNSCMKLLHLDWEAENNKIKLDCKNLAPGLYFLALENEKSIRFIKMIVAR